MRARTDEANVACARVLSWAARGPERQPKPRLFCAQERHRPFRSEQRVVLHHEDPGGADGQSLEQPVVDAVDIDREQINLAGVGPSKAKTEPPGR